MRGGTLLTGWKGALFKEWTLATQITAGSGLPETPVYLAPVPGTGCHRQYPARLYRRAAYARTEAVLNPAHTRAPAGTMGQCGAGFASPGPHSSV